MGLSHGEECKENCKQTCNANARQQNRTGEIVFGVDGKIHNIRIVRLLINQIDNILDSLHDAPGFPEGKRQEKSKVSQRQLAAESRQKLYAGGPANVEVGQMVPQLDILSQASVFITHAGMGGTGEAIYYGVPMIAIPQMEEQAITARQIEKLGLGCAFLDKNAITSESLKAAIVKLLTQPSYKATAAEFSADMKSLGGAKASAEALLHFLKH